MIDPVALSGGRRVETSITEMNADGEIGYGYSIDVHAGDIAYHVASDGWWDSDMIAEMMAESALDSWLKRGLLRASDARYNATVLPRIKASLGGDATLIYETPWQSAKDFETNPDYLSSPVVAIFRGLIVERGGEFFLGVTRRDAPAPAKPSWMPFSSFQDAYHACWKALGGLETVDHPGIANAAACGSDVRAALSLDDEALEALDRSFFRREEIGLVVDDEQEVADDSELVDMPTCFGLK